MVIEDNGVGFDPLAPRSTDRRGLGLIGMRERAALYGGCVETGDRAGGGFRVAAHIPAGPA